MKIAGVQIAKGESKQVNLDIARLTSGTEIEVPVFVSRGLIDGPVLLLMAGLHGDEINCVDAVRSVLQGNLNQVDRGTVICIPVLNIFGFINFSREVPDGKDVNRSFPGFSKGSLASQVAYHLSKDVLPHCDYIIDLHTGGASRFNVPQTRCVFDNQKAKELALAFNAPFTLHSDLINKSLRKTADNMGKTIIVYEGGEALRFDKQAKQQAITGIKNVISYLGMKLYSQSKDPTKILNRRKWLRAPNSGLFNSKVEAGEKVENQQILGYVSGPYADYHNACYSPKDGYVVTVNNNPLVNRGDAIVQLAFND
jgi:predicted deacylase